MSVTINGGANGFAAGNYGANYLVFGNPNAASMDGGRLHPGLLPGRAVHHRSVRRALRHLRLQRRPDASSTYASLWADSTVPWRPIFCVNNIANTPDDGRLRARAQLFQVQPNYLTGCDTGRARPATSAA